MTYVCTLCNKPSLPSIYGTYCTNCSNVKRDEAGEFDRLKFDYSEFEIPYRPMDNNIFMLVIACIILILFVVNL